MQLQLFENKGDLMIVIKDAPKGTKDQLEKMLADYAITELKGLVKAEPQIPDPNEGWKKVSEEDDIPFEKKDDVFETKSDFKNDNIPFNKPKKNSILFKDFEIQDPAEALNDPYNPFE